MTVLFTVQVAMRTEDKDLKSKAMMVHKSTGLLVAALVVPRIANRLLSKIPAHHPGMKGYSQLSAQPDLSTLRMMTPCPYLPYVLTFRVLFCFPEMHAIERVAADAGHYALYGMMVAMPATGELLPVILCYG